MKRHLWCGIRPRLRASSPLGFGDGVREVGEERGAVVFLVRTARVVAAIRIAATPVSSARRARAFGDDRSILRSILRGVPPRARRGDDPGIRREIRRAFTRGEKVARRDAFARLSLRQSPSARRRAPRRRNEPAFFAARVFAFFLLSKPVREPRLRSFHVREEGRQRPFPRDVPMMFR